MSVDEIHSIDTIVEGKKGTIYFVIMEGREWNTIKYPGIKLMAKINNLRHYSESPKAQKKYGRKIKIILYPKYTPPADILKILRAEKIFLATEVKDGKIKLSK